MKFSWKLDIILRSSWIFFFFFINLQYLTGKRIKTDSMWEKVKCVETGVWCYLYGHGGPTASLIFGKRSWQNRWAGRCQEKGHERSSRMITFFPPLHSKSWDSGVKMLNFCEGDWLERDCSKQRKRRSTNFFDRGYQDMFYVLYPEKSVL